MAEQLQNFGSTTVNESLSDSDTTVTVTDGSVFPSSGNFRVNCEDEIMLVTARSGNDLTVTRGAESTTAVSHASGSIIKAVLTAAGLDQAITDRLDPDLPDYVQFAADTNYTSGITWGNSSTPENFTYELTPPTGAKGLICFWACDYVGGATSAHKLLSVTYGNVAMTLYADITTVGDNGGTYFHLLDLSSAEDTSIRFARTLYRGASLMPVWIIAPLAVAVEDSSTTLNNGTSPWQPSVTTGKGASIVVASLADGTVTIPTTPGTTLLSAKNPSQGGQMGMSKVEEATPLDTVSVSQTFANNLWSAAVSYDIPTLVIQSMSDHLDVATDTPSEGSSMVWDDAAGLWGPGQILLSGAGTPESVVSAPVGAMFLRSDGGTSTSFTVGSYLETTTTFDFTVDAVVKATITSTGGSVLYVKESGGTGNTGWAEK